MSVRTLRIFPDPVLRTPCAQVDVFDQVLDQLLDDLGESMYAHKGVGLAAPQIGVPLRVMVVDADQKEGTPRLVELVNPELVGTSEEVEEREEGCLSFPDESEKVQRPAMVTLRAVDRRGQPFELTGRGLLATALQHELDHLNGVLFIDHISSLKRSLVSRRMKKLAKRSEG